MPNEEIDFPHGATVLKQGDAGGFFYILLSGSVEVYKDNNLLTTLMFPGTIFGEMADILGKPRTCTVKVKGAARLAKVQSHPMEELIKDQPDVVVKIIKTLASRLERTTAKLSDNIKDSPMWTVDPSKKHG